MGQGPARWDRTRGLRLCDRRVRQGRTKLTCRALVDLQQTKELVPQRGLGPWRENVLRPQGFVDSEPANERTLQLLVVAQPEKGLTPQRLAAPQPEKVLVPKEVVDRQRAKGLVPREVLDRPLERELTPGKLVDPRQVMGARPRDLALQQPLMQLAHQAASARKLRHRLAL